MLDEEIFDSVTWETPSAPPYETDAPPKSSGPGYRQSNAEGSDASSPQDPKWEGYLIASIKDPIKELPDTKDSYVSYLVVAEVSGCS